MAGLVPKKMGPAVLSGRQAAVQKQRRSGEAGANGGFPARLTRKRKPRPGLGVAAISPKQPAARRRRCKRAHFGTTSLKPRRPHPSLIPTGPGKPSHVQRPPGPVIFSKAYGTTNLSTKEKPVVEKASLFPFVLMLLTLAISRITVRYQTEIRGGAI